MYSRVLVPLDGSIFAAQALPYARMIAGALNADIELFQAVPTLTDTVRSWHMRYDEDDLDTHVPGPSLEQWRDIHHRVVREAEQELEQQAEGLRAAGFSARARVGVGDAAEAIAEEAEGRADTLIVMTTHGRSGIARWWIGSVADRLLRITTTPALVVRCLGEEMAPAEPRIGTVVLPLDGSRLSEQAVPHAMALSKALDARVDVLIAVNSPAYEPIRYPVPEAYPTDLNARAGEYAAGVVARLETAGIPAGASTIEDDPAGAITETAETTPDSIVVMSTHGRSGLKRWMLGSVADKVVRHSGRPVLLVRAREAAAVPAQAPAAAA